MRGMQLSPDTNVQLHMLAPLVGSPLYELHKNNLKFDGHSSDISLFLLTDDEIETVKRYPDVFPSFYFIPTPDLNRNLVKSLSAVPQASAREIESMCRARPAGRSETVP